MKILWLASWYPHDAQPLSGDFIQRQAKALSVFYPVTVIFLTKDELKSGSHGIRINTNMDGELTEHIIYYKTPGLSVRYFEKLISFVRYKSNFKSALRSYIKQLGIPDIVHVHIPFRAGWMGVWLKKKYKTPLIVTEHWAGYDPSNPDNYFNRPAFFRHLVSKTFKEADCIAPVSEDLARKLKSIFATNNYKVIPNSIDLTVFNYKLEPIEEFIFLHNGSIFPGQKNTEGLLHVLHQLKSKIESWKCIIFGKVNAEVIKLSNTLGLESVVKFIGEIPHADVAALMKKSKVLVNFSRYENQPCTILEALCSGLPVIASRVGGIPELIDPGNGILVESENKEELLKAVERMISNYDHFSREKIAANAREKFGSLIVGRQISALYAEYAPSS